MIRSKIFITVLGFGISFSSCGQSTTQNNPLQESIKINSTESTHKISTAKMKIEIWSDVMCPFCYIGKRKFETALEKFPHKDEIEIVWKSYQLMPDLEKGKVNNLEQLLVDKKGISKEQIRSMNAQVAQAGKQVGIDFNFERALGVNTLDAHRFIHFAKVHNKQIEAEEILFKSYFTEGKNIADFKVLTELGKQIGLDDDALKTALENGSYADAVQKDISEAQQVGVRGVPFFVVNRKYAVSGAQESSSFLEVLEKSFTEWKKDNPSGLINLSEGASCDVDGNCD